MSLKLMDENDPNASLELHMAEKLRVLDAMPKNIWAHMYDVRDLYESIRLLNNQIRELKQSKIEIVK